MKLENISDDLLTFTVREKDAELIFHKPEYKTTIELANILGWIHQLGVNHPDIELRIGAKLK